MDFLETGDIILFSGTSWLSYFIEFFGYSPYSHVGMIIRNPKWLNPELEDGIYLLESGRNPTPDSEDHQIKTGVQIHLLSDVLSFTEKGSVFVRKVECVRDEHFYERIRVVHHRIHNRTYDLRVFDWLLAEYNLFFPLEISNSYQHTDSYWCSALLSYIFFHLKLIAPVNWTLISPREFSSRGSLLTFKCQISKEELIW